MLPTLGQQLRHARVQRGLSLLDIAHKTRIPAAKIKDLEEDCYTNFGSLTYAKSFLKGYASFLNIDAQAILDQIQPPPLGGESSYAYLTRSLGTWLKPRQTRPLSHARPTATQRGSYVTMSIIGCTVLLAGVSVLFGSVFKSHEPVANQSESEPVEQVQAAVVTTPSVQKDDSGKPSWTAPTDAPVGTAANSQETTTTTPASTNGPVPHAVPVDVPPGQVVDSHGQIITPVKAVPVE